MVNELGVLQVVQQPTRRANEQIHSFLQPHAFRLSVHSTHQQANRFVVEMPDFLSNLVHLNRELSSRRDHNDSSSVLLLKLETVQELETRD